ncbi:hypothetical protein [Polyangium fumosum]|uniref:hypothetical protein n=1 Tax=Polyangium fumosum TaxID=889272 RepID=UPI0014790D73|nr:hypothetical protein [Polyangium fumosum]
MSAEREREILRRLVAQSLAVPLQYLAVHDATVVAQGADGTLDLRLDSAEIPGLSGVPVWLGLPGIRVEVAKGARVKVGFSEGDPGKPFAGLWETDAAMIRIVLGGGTKAVARVDDATDSGTLVLRTVTEPAALCTIEWKPPGSAVAIVLGALGVQVSGPSIVEFPIRGIITSGLASLLG